MALAKMIAIAILPSHWCVGSFLQECGKHLVGDWKPGASGATRSILCETHIIKHALTA